ncbi:hypothetical protein O9K51_00023 [Purpureocillium lavendulum]|uniref:Uncharacterized protein n=1 Tax=Purpureocillium lavendulum TaxID=1247861 RepID=A0AB34G2A2_9HYPO|nr:hypothetical protein O9K51_00023 [Purpureocillium lavendulum]
MVCPPGPFGYCVPSSVPPSDPSRKFSKFADCTVKSWNGVPLEQPVCDKGDEGDEGDEGRVGDEGDEDIKVGGALEEA